MSEQPKRDHRAVLQFIERFAAVFEEAGMARMPARVFAALLATDSGRLTAAELAELLRVSPAAISGAVRYLVQVSLAVREREPGSRRDHYRVWEDTWYQAALRRDQMMSRWMSTAREGIEALGVQTPAGARIAETLAYFEFVHEEMPALLKRWQERKAQLRSARAE
jgi:DNA-binding transcriptional regulator GbsR (MarR family)